MPFLAAEKLHRAGFPFHLTTVSTRHLLLVLGDQLDWQSSLFDGADPSADLIWMAEAREESTHVWSHRARIALFLSAMRHFAESLRSQGYQVAYTRLDDPHAASLAESLARTIADERPRELRVVQPGDFRVLQSIRAVANRASVPLTVLDDRHFLCSLPDFRSHARGRKQLRMEYFYREMRKRLGVLMEGAGEPAGGQWNYDVENRKSFGSAGPPLLPPSPEFWADAITAEVLRLVEREFPHHPGSLQSFSWPVTREQALTALSDFIENRLPGFGDYQDAMWTAEPLLFHSRLASSLNLKLLHPREVIDAAEQAWRGNPKRYPLAAVEGFIRQILGWREYVRGIYWLYMPGYLERNALGATRDLPSFYWNAETEMRCLREAIGQTLEYGYAHHIQRLMITGLYALLYGVHPRQVHEWYLAVYVDAVEWVELPNTLGMSQFADGGVMASKPYVASGKYIQRMSNYCHSCRYQPDEATGESACPFTTLYWDFLLRHQQALASNPRMAMQLRNLARISAERRNLIQIQAARHREAISQAPASRPG
jgi:deoxyribodipyrimidine photolyase-related protein